MLVKLTFWENLWKFAQTHANKGYFEKKQGFWAHTDTSIISSVITKLCHLCFATQVIHMSLKSSHQPILKPYTHPTKDNMLHAGFKPIPETSPSRHVAPLASALCVFLLFYTDEDVEEDVWLHNGNVGKEHHLIHYRTSCVHPKHA